MIHAGEAHAGFLAGSWSVDETFDVVSAAPDRSSGRNAENAMRFRRGWFLGDGTGAGKGRQVAGILLDNWLKGRRRAVWVSKSDKLIEDAQRDWSALGQERLLVTPLSRFRQGTPIRLAEGILFTTYATLRSEARDDKASRVKQIVDWLGSRFRRRDRVRREPTPCRTPPAAKGSAAIKRPRSRAAPACAFSTRCPKPASSMSRRPAPPRVHNLAYAQRLGLWGGEDFPFATRAEFVEAIEAGGVAAMEVLARDLKALGLYAARSLSYEGVEYELLEHRLSDEQIAIYDSYAGAFGVIHNNLDAALEAANITGEMGTLNAQAKSAARSAFESAKQRFFNHLITAMKTPSLIASIDRDLAGRSSRRDPDRLHRRGADGAPARGDSDRRMGRRTGRHYSARVCSGLSRPQLPDPALRAFHRQRRQSVVASRLSRRPARAVPGGGRSPRPADREAGVPAARAWRARPDRPALWRGHGGGGDGPLPADRSQGMTGSTVENRAASANLAEAQAFMDDAKRILVFSDAGGTGRSYHAELSARNRRLRVHYLLEPGWKADAAIQGLGRTNRTNQAQPPLFRPIATNVKAEKRFLSTIARRLDTLGAITKGQRQTGGQGLFRPRDNLESSYARDALRQLYVLLVAGKVEGCSLGVFQDATGLKLTDSNGIKDEQPPITTFLNRLLALTIELQNILFTAFEQLLNARIEGAIASGTYDLGLETLTAESFVVTDRQTIYTHPGTSAETRLLTITQRERNQPVTLIEALDRLSDPRALLLINSQSGRPAVQIPAPSVMLDDGEVERRVRLIRPMERPAIPLATMPQTHWQEADRETFARSWAAEVAAVPAFIDSTIHIVAGLLLPIWKRLPNESTRVYRLQTDAGERIVGRKVSAAWAAGALEGDATKLSADDAFAALMAGKTVLDLAEGLQLRQRSRHGRQPDRTDRLHRRDAGAAARLGPLP